MTTFRATGPKHLFTSVRSQDGEYLYTKLLQKKLHIQSTSYEWRLTGHVHVLQPGHIV